MALKGSRGIDPPILDLGLRDDWSTSRPSKFAIGKVRRCPFNRRLFGPHNSSERFQEEAKFAPAGIQTPHHPVWNVVALPATLMNEL
jgi:hypothetical protein